MAFDELLDRLWFFDFEVFAHDVLMVTIDYRTHTRKVFYNASCEEYENFINEYNPILCGFNSISYDKYILKACLLGYSPEEIKQINDYIIEGDNQGWSYHWEGYCELPTVWDLYQFYKTFKSLKETEGNLRLSITETTVPFDLPTKWTKEQYEEVLYYCTKDVEALIPLFDYFEKKFKARYIVCKIGNIEYEKGLALTDANLTATLLGAKRKEHDDNFKYEYPKCIDKSKIPKNVLEYIDDLIEHNDLDYKIPAPSVVFGNMEAQLGVGGIHGFLQDGIVYYDRGDNLKCE